MLDFFEQQQRARRRTTLLVVMYLIGVAVVTIATVPPVMLAASGFLGRGRDSILLRTDQPAGIDWLLHSEQGQILLAVSCLITLAIIFGTSGFKYLELRGGGDGVARRLGGRRLLTNTTDPEERRLLNVVEEMAIASAVPVPPVYVLDDEHGINAFAAGFSPSDAVIGVTRGCVRALTREQLQGVIAHEFSHILNGDMRLSLRMIALLHGILAVQMMGYILVRVRGRKAGGVVLAGVAMLVVGFVGGLIAKVIKAMISRQREFLADASAVQFTRDSGGLSGALRVIGGGHERGVLQAANAEECSHMYFVKGLDGWLDGLFSTHPPLPERIRRLDPRWDGTWLKPRPAPVYAEPAAKKAGIPLAPFAAATAAAVVEDLAAKASVRGASGGLSSDEVVRRMAAARDLLDGAPQLVEAARDPWEAQALVLGMLLDSQPAVRVTQLDAAKVHLDHAVIGRADALGGEVRRAGRALRLPLLEVALGALAAMSPAQHKAFRAAADALIHADKRVSLFEWCLERLLIVHLDRRFTDPRPTPVQYYKFTRLGAECGLVLSALAWAGGADADGAARGFQLASRALGLPGLTLGDRSMKLEELERALGVLSTVSAPLKRHLVMACAAAVGADAEVRADESELLRAVADTLGVPLAAIGPT
ncbi:Protease HtpX [Phycisphaerales bacterium]|nr:Protease HtpX [Phycisphaerales bacterium]